MANSYGVDLGTCNIKIYNKHTDEVVTQKNTIAVINRNQLYAYGDNAYAMYEKAPSHIQVCFPLKDGVIAEYAYMQTVIQEIFEHDIKGHTRGSEILIAIPAKTTEVERKAFYDLLYKSKLKPKKVFLCDKAIANAVGLGLDVNHPLGYMVVDIGADVTEIAVVSAGGLVTSELISFGGNQLDACIANHIKREYNIVIGNKTASQLKERLGTAMTGRNGSSKVFGLDVISGLPLQITIDASVIHEAIKDSLESICYSVKQVLEQTPPELTKDIIKNGIYLTGGTSKIAELNKLLANITGFAVNTSDDPCNTVAKGLGKIATHPELEHLTYTMRNRLFR